MPGSGDKFGEKYNQCLQKWHGGVSLEVNFQILIGMRAEARRGCGNETEI